MMSPCSHRIRRWIIALVAAFISAASVARADPPLLESETRVASDHCTGCRVFICGHSFHIFNARYLGPLATLAQMPDHETVGQQMIGGSSVTQHWNLPDEKNRCKQALKRGDVDVLTMSPNWIIPDPAIEKFVDLGLEHNAHMRFVVQMSWTAFDSMTRGTLKDLEDRNTKTIADLRPAQQAFAEAIETQVAEINAKHDRPVVFISPVGYAVLKLREAVIDGKAPGVKRQSDLYRDLLGHGQPPIVALCVYVNYATIYRRSPVGLEPFDTFSGAVTPELHQLLQAIAWEVVSTYPQSGVDGSVATDAASQK